MRADQFGGFNRDLPDDGPMVRIRTPNYHEMDRCCDLVRANWGDEAAERCHEQFIEYWKGGRYAPIFVVAVDGAEDVLGFAAYQRTMLMKGAFDLIWLAVVPEHKSRRIGTVLTEWRINKIIAEGDAQFIQLVTQKPAYFSKFGFFRLHHVGNEWYVMLKLLKTTEI